MPVVKLGADSRIIVPQDVLDELGAKPGDMLRVHFELVAEDDRVDEPLGPETRAALREAKADIAAGRVHGPFDSTDELIQFLKSTSSESDA